MNVFTAETFTTTDKKPRNKCFPFYVLQCTFCLLFVGDDWDWTIARNLEIWDHIFVSGSTWELNYSLFRPAYSDMPMAQWCQSNFFVRYKAVWSSKFMVNTQHYGKKKHILLKEIERGVILLSEHDKFWIDFTCQ